MSIHGGVKFGLACVGALLVTCGDGFGQRAWAKATTTVASEFCIDAGGIASARDVSEIQNQLAPIFADAPCAVSHPRVMLSEPIRLSPDLEHFVLTGTADGYRIAAQGSTKGELVRNLRVRVSARIHRPIAAR